MMIRREGRGDAEVIRAVVGTAFARPDAGGREPGEARLVDELRESQAWLPALSLVATEPEGEIIGHVLCSRAHVGEAPVLALGPLSVRPGRQRAGVGSALGSEYQITPAVPAWRPYFQVRTLASYQPSVRGAFRYAEPFDRT
jgi:putative acetyltransferase